MSRAFVFVAAIGRKFGLLTVVDDKKSSWMVRCECGDVFSARRDYVIRGLTKACRSCGQKTHGMDGTKIYNVWAGMKQRCNNPQSHAYSRYGGRGIKVCEAWLKFENFFADMGECPENKSLGRIDNDGDYSPENCRWETAKQQIRNRSNTRLYAYQNRMATLGELADEKGMPVKQLRYRIEVEGMTIDEAMAKPYQPRTKVSQST